MLLHFLAWAKDERAVIAIEAGLLMPLLIMLFFGTLDTGQAVLINQKLINASQTVGDLIGREESVNEEEVQDIVEAGRLSLAPYSTEHLGFDIAGIQFMGGPMRPEEMWRVTENMDSGADLVDNARGLGADQEGVVGVIAEYLYEPYFSGIFTGPFVMSEVTYARGRNGLYIPKE